MVEKLFDNITDILEFHPVTQDMFDIILNWYHLINKEPFLAGSVPERFLAFYILWERQTL